jgi:hypothetical protein
MIHDIWITEYAYFNFHINNQSSDDESPPAKRSRFFNPFAANSQVSQLLRTTAVLGDEYEIWQRDRERTDSEVRNPLAYWAARQDSYPRLSRMVMDFLTIQPMSAECERAFSAAGRMVVSTRARLDAETIGICQILRSWYRANVLPNTDIKLAPVDLDISHIITSNSDNEELEYRGQKLATSDIDSE